MTRSGWKRRGCLGGLLGTAAVIVLAPFQGVIWDGGFPPAEYRITFVEGAGRPVPGVSLRVLTQAGGESHFYPIDEVLPGGAPVSDAGGRMVFHHASDGLEFGGREYRNLLDMRFGDTGAPQYVCVFSLADKEVYRLRYAEVVPRDERPHAPRVTRAWAFPDRPAREDATHRDDRAARRVRLFDGNRDGRLDREERTAAGYFERTTERAEFGGGKRDIEFFVVERTIVISVP